MGMLLTLLVLVLVMCFYMHLHHQFFMCPCTATNDTATDLAEVHAHDATDLAEMM
jgi:zona occludens toxin (predicted ATPase)